MTNNGEVDLWSITDKFLASLNGERANHIQELDCYTLYADESSESRFKYESGKYAVLKKDSFGASNVHAFMDESLMFLSGRMVEIDIGDGRFRIVADKSEKVYGVYFVDGGKSCEIPVDAEKTICRIGRADCCVFLTVGIGGFYYCEKFYAPVARMMLERLAKGNARASRIGNCAILWRKRRQ